GDRARRGPAPRRGSVREGAPRPSGTRGLSRNAGVTALLEIDGLRAGYGDHEILRGVRLAVGSSEIVAIIGPNGACQSTLLHTRPGLLSPRSGDVRFDGSRIGGHAPEEIIRRGVCFVPQESNVFPSLSIEENLLIGGWAAPARRAERVRAV